MCHPAWVTQTEVMITIDNLTKTYGSKTVVDHLSFEVQPGLVTGFLGPNGAGKSTTMRMILGLERPTSGLALFDGLAYQELKDPLRTVGALLDASWVHPQRSAAGHLTWMAAAAGLPKQRVGEVLDIVGLSDVAGKKAGSFSLGMRQRLGLAAALLGDPEYLLFDEPVNGLDPEGIHWIRRIMRRLASEGRTVIVSSHLLAEMAQTADRLVVIGKGQLIADTTVAEFTSDDGPAQILVRSTELARLHQALEGVGATCTPAQDNHGPLMRVAGLNAMQIAEVAMRQQILVFELAPQQASLEEVFMRRTTGAVEYNAHEGTTALGHNNSQEMAR